MGIQQSCSMGDITFLNPGTIVVKGKEEHAMFAWSSFDVDNDIKKLMNRAARSIDGNHIKGVVQIDKTKGVSFAVILSEEAMEFTTEVTQQFLQAFRAELEAEPVDVQEGMAIHSETRRHGDFWYQAD